MVEPRERCRGADFLLTAFPSSLLHQLRRESDLVPGALSGLEVMGQCRRIVFEPCAGLWLWCAKGASCFQEGNQVWDENRC